MKPAKLQEAKLAIRFSAKFFLPKTTKKIEPAALLVLPRNASMKLPSRGNSMVEGTINHLPFRAVLKPNGKGSHQLSVSMAMRDAVGVDVGDTATLEITRVGEEPETRVPTDLRRALESEPQALESWMDITPMARRDWIFSICTAKQEETRRRRIKKTCNMLAYGKRRLCCFPGIKWLMKKNAKSCGMWLPLPSSKK